MPKGLELRKPAYHTVLYHGVPMFRATAWALFDYEAHGGHLIVNSGIRRESIVKTWRGKGLRSGYKSQKQLWDGFQAGLPGFFPANRPGFSSHEGYADGVAVFHKADGSRAPRGAEIVKYEWGLDAVDKPGGDARRLTAWLNLHGYRAVRPYATNSERHHLCFRKSPAANARKRLARWIATGR
jgi:hypothetical protein